MRLGILAFLGIITVGIIIFVLVSQSLRRYEAQELERLKKNLYQ